MDAPIDLQAETYRVGELILKCLSDLGHVWEARDGTLVEVRFAAARVVAGQYALFEVDTLRLPRKVTAADLTHPRVIHHLATVCGRPVSVFDTRGITYIVNLVPAAPKPAPRLPRHVALTWDRLLAWAELQHNRRIDDDLEGCQQANSQGHSHLLQTWIARCPPSRGLSNAMAQPARGRAK